MKKLTIDEWNVLQKISSKLKMDWFFLKHDSEFDVDYIVDLENNEVISLATGILQLNEGVVDLDFLDDKEKKVYEDLLNKL